MKIAITANGPGLDSHITDKFGCCQYFVIFDLDEDSMYAFENPYHKTGGGGCADCRVQLKTMGVNTIITKMCGPNVQKSFQSDDINIVTGIDGKLVDVLSDVKKGNLPIPDHTYQMSLVVENILTSTERRNFKERRFPRPARAFWKDEAEYKHAMDQSFDQSLDQSIDQSMWNDLTDMANL